MANINDSYFDGYYKDIWRAIIPAELTAKETEFMLPYFKLGTGSRVLDIMCGYGRHSLALARHGISVTAVDNLPAYIDEIRKIAGTENLPVNPVLSNITDYKSEDLFDLVICMGNSLNFFTAIELSKILGNVSSQLKKGGHFLINSWTIAEIVMKNFKEKGWSQVGELKFLTESRFLFHPTRIETESVIIDPRGKTETKTGIDYIYSVAELESMLNQAGFRLNEVYSIPGKKKFSLGELRAYIIAEKL